MRRNYTSNPPCQRRGWSGGWQARRHIDCPRTYNTFGGGWSWRYCPYTRARHFKTSVDYERDRVMERVLSCPDCFAEAYHAYPSDGERVIDTVERRGWATFRGVRFQHPIAREQEELRRYGFKSWLEVPLDHPIFAEPEDLDDMADAA